MKWVFNDQIRLIFRDNVPQDTMYIGCPKINEKRCFAK